MNAALYVLLLHTDKREMREINFFNTHPPMRRKRRKKMLKLFSVITKE